MVSAGWVSLEEVRGEEMSAVTVEADTGSGLVGSLAVALVVAVGGVELVTGGAEEAGDEGDEGVTGVSGVIVEIASGDRGVVLADDGTKDSGV